MKITVILSLVQTEFILAVRTNAAISIVKDFVIFLYFIYINVTKMIV